MPIRSKAQMRLLFAKENAGELPKGTAKKWVRHTKTPLRSLPERVKEALEGISAMLSPTPITQLGGNTKSMFDDAENVARGPNTGVPDKPVAISSASFLSGASKPGHGFDTTSTSPTMGKLLKPSSGAISKLPNLEKSGDDKSLAAGIMRPDQSPLTMQEPKPSASSSTSVPSLSPSDLGSDPLLSNNGPGKPSTTVPASGKPATTPPLIDFDKINTKLDPDMSAGGDMQRALSSIVNPLAGLNSTPPLVFKDGRPVPQDVLAKYDNPASDASPYKGWFNKLPTANNSTTTPWSNYELSPDGQAAAKQWAMNDKQFAQLSPEQQLSRMWSRPRAQFEQDLLNGRAESLSPDDLHRRLSQPFNHWSQQGYHAGLPNHGLVPDNASLAIPASMGASLMGGAGRAAAGGAGEVLFGGGAAPAIEAAAAPAAGSGAGGGLLASTVPWLRSGAGAVVDPLGAAVRGAYSLPGVAGRVAGPATAATTFAPRLLTGTGAAGNLLRGTGANPSLWAAGTAGAHSLLPKDSQLGLLSPVQALAASGTALNNGASPAHVGSELYQSQVTRPLFGGYENIVKPTAQSLGDAWNESSSLGDFANKGVVKLENKFGPGINQIIDPIRGNANQLTQGGSLLPAGVAGAIGEGLRKSEPTPTTALGDDSPGSFENQYNDAFARGDVAAVQKLRDQQVQLAATNPSQARLSVISSISPADMPISQDPETLGLYEKAKTDPAAYQALHEKHERDFAAKIDGPEAAVAGAGVAAVQGPYAKYKESVSAYNSTQNAIAQAKAEGRPVTSEMLDQERLQKQRVADLRWQVQGRAAQHFDREVVQPTLQEADAMTGKIQAIRARAAAGPLSVEDAQQAQALKQQATRTIDTVSRYSMLRAQLDGRDASPDLSRLKTVSDFHRELSARTPVLDQNGNPVMTSVTDPATGKVTSVPATQASTTLGRQVDSAVMGKIYGAASANGGTANLDQVKAVASGLDDTSKMLLYGGMGLAAVAALGSMLGFGGGAATILGLLGVGAAGYGLYRNEDVQNDPAKLFQGGFWKQLFGISGGDGSAQSPNATNAQTPTSNPAGTSTQSTAANRPPPTTGGTTDANNAAKYFGVNPQVVNNAVSGKLSTNDKLSIVSAFKNKLNDPGLPQVLQQIPEAARQQMANSLAKELQASAFSVNRMGLSASGVGKNEIARMLQVLRQTGITPQG